MLLLLGAAFYARAEAEVAEGRRGKACEAARAAFRHSPTNVVAAWRLARTCFDCSLEAPEKSRRAICAEEGMAAARAALKLDPRSAAGFYYLALNEGQLASTKTLGALSLVKDMERHLLRARELDQTFDYGDPDRTLGLLYRDAPGWPISVGSRKKARRHLERALAIAPAYFENHLNLIETFIQWRKRKEALRAYAAARKLLPDALCRFTGERWAGSWADWNRRWTRAEATIQQWREKEKSR
jgi:tetratricopeptide (TPR) repeat protein